jgi:hypothetical protein
MLTQIRRMSCILLDYARSIEVCKKYARSMQEVYCAGRPSQICDLVVDRTYFYTSSHTSILLTIRSMQEVCKKYARSMQEVCKKYARIMFRSIEVC